MLTPLCVSKMTCLPNFFLDNGQSQTKHVCQHNRGMALTCSCCHRDSILCVQCIHISPWFLWSPVLTRLYVSLLRHTLMNPETLWGRPVLEAFLVQTLDLAVTKHEGYSCFQTLGAGIVSYKNYSLFWLRHDKGKAMSFCFICQFIPKVTGLHFKR